jgi:hypothetical protein
MIFDRTGLNIFLAGWIFKSPFWPKFLTSLKKQAPTREGKRNGNLTVVEVVVEVVEVVVVEKRAATILSSSSTSMQETSMGESRSPFSDAQTS